MASTFFSCSFSFGILAAANPKCFMAFVEGRSRRRSLQSTQLVIEMVDGIAVPKTTLTKRKIKAL